MPVAKRGPVKKPMKEMATAAATMFGTLVSSAMYLAVEVPRIHLQPEDDLKDDCQATVKEDHPLLAETMGWLGQQQPPYKTTSVETCRDVAHLGQIASADVDQVLNDPAVGGDLRPDVEEVEHAQQPDAGCLQ